MACEVVAISGIEFHKLTLSSDGFIDEDEQQAKNLVEDLEQHIEAESHQTQQLLRNSNNKINSELPSTTNTSSDEESEPPSQLSTSSADNNNSPSTDDVLVADDTAAVAINSNKKRRKGWLGYVVKQLSSWVTVHQQSSMIRVLTAPGELLDLCEAADLAGDDELWTEWEWIVSETEKAAAKWSEEEARRVKDELVLLRKNASFMKSRPAFMASARAAIQRKQFSADELDLLVSTELDANKRSKIVSDVVMAFAEGWLQMLIERFFGSKSIELQDSFRESFFEGAYRKGVVGGLKEVGWQASHGPGGTGLSPQVLGDILWALWKALLSAVRFTLDEDLDIEGMKAMVDGVCGCQDSVIDLWYCTVRNSVFGSAREGVLPERWSMQDKAEKERVAELKRKGRVDARYEAKQTIITEPLLERQQLSDLKRLLESSLHFYVIDP